MFFFNSHKQVQWHISAAPPPPLSIQGNMRLRYKCFEKQSKDFFKKRIRFFFIGKVTYPISGGIQMLSQCKVYKLIFNEFLCRIIKSTCNIIMLICKINCIQVLKNVHVWLVEYARCTLSMSTFNLFMLCKVWVKYFDKQFIQVNMRDKCVT